MMSFASKAVLSKALSMYGKRLKEKNYSDLINCKNISEVCFYLKSKTIYRKFLKDLDENNIRRVDLEERINSKLIEDFIVLGRYDLAIGENFFGYIIKRLEIPAIIKCLIFLLSNTNTRKSTNSSVFQKYSKINFKELELAKDYNEFLKILKYTPYFKLLSKFKQNSDGTIDLSAVENGLYFYMNTYFKDTIEKYTSGKAKNILLKIFNDFSDLTNMVWIIRMRKFYKISNENIESKLLKFGNLKKQNLKNFIEAKSDKQMMEDMKNTSLGKRWFSKNLDMVDRIPLNMQFQKSKHNIRFSTFSPIVMMSYFSLCEVEISNIINIIEGVKYELPSEEISKMLMI